MTGRYDAGDGEEKMDRLAAFEQMLSDLQAQAELEKRKMDKLKAEIEVAKEKIRHIDEGIQQEDKKAE